MILVSQGSRQVESPFDLLGSDEDAITGAITWTLGQSPTLTSILIATLTGYSGPFDEVQISFQKNEREKGRTDLEIFVPGEVHLILEAKRGWELPTHRQLELYTQRRSFVGSRANFKMLVTLSETDNRYAKLFLPTHINQFPIRHLSRRDLVSLVSKSNSTTTGVHEKKSLRTLLAYLNKTMKKPNAQSNEVYVVSLNRQLLDPSWNGTTFMDVVYRHRKYFHPVGAGWPATPPNYIAFRYDGILQSIHHIDEAIVTKDLADTAPGNLPSYPVQHPHFIYSLGPAMRPPLKVPAGARIVRSNRVWVALDLLLTATSITEALLESKKRNTG